MGTFARKPHLIITLRARLLIGFMALSLPLLLLIMILLPKVDSMVKFSHMIQKENLPEVLDTEIYQVRDILSHWIRADDPNVKAKFSKAWGKINHTITMWNSVLTELGNEDLLERWEALKQMYEPLYQAQLILINTPRDPENLSSLDNQLLKIRPLEDRMIDSIIGPILQNGERADGMYSFVAKNIKKNLNAININLVSLKSSAFWLLVFAVFLTVIVPLLTQHSISILIDDAIKIAERIASGERETAINIRSVDKLGKLLLSLKAMQEAIKKNEQKLHEKEEDSRSLFEKLFNSSKKLSEHSSKVAAGDLRERLELDEHDVLHDLGKDLNLMTNGLALTTQKITQVSSDIVTMVETVLKSANEQSEGITSQASAINEISASLEEIDKSSKQTMAKAQLLREVAKNTYEQGKLGTESVVQSIEGIKVAEDKMKLIAETILDLSSHTQQIGDITAVVNTLSQQSKMLALNAAIEASKAGEAGKGFAAVATEVRNLAEQSEQSTVQVQKILEDIRRTTEKAVNVTEEGTKSLDSGSKLIEKAGEVIHALSKMINEASISSQHIEVAIRQEAVGIEQIVESMNEINRATATFSSGIKEMMTFIHNLDEIAKHLKDDISSYKV